MKLEYTRCGDYYLPNIVMPQESEETKGALCVEMEGVGLFTIANYRKLFERAKTGFVPRIIAR